MSATARTPAISHRKHNLESIQVSRMKATLFVVGCMALRGIAGASIFLYCPISLKNFDYFGM